MSAAGDLSATESTTANKILLDSRCQATALSTSDQRHPYPSAAVLHTGASDQLVYHSFRLLMSDDDFWGHPIKRTPTAADNGVAAVAPTTGRQRVQKEPIEATAAFEQQPAPSAAASTNISVDRRSHASSSGDGFSSSSDPFYSDDSADSDSDDMPIDEVERGGSHSTSSDEATPAEPFRFTPHASPDGPYPVIMKTRRPTPSPAKRKTVERYVVEDAGTTKKAVSKITKDSSKTLRKRRPRRSAEIDPVSKSATTTITVLSAGRSAGAMKSARSSALADRVHYLEQKLREALTMNKTLESVQKRQDAALARVGKERLALGNDGRPLVDRHLEEVRVLREQVRQQRHKLRDQERLLYKRNSAMQRINDKAKQLEAALKDRDASSNKALQKSHPPSAAMQIELEEKNKRVQELQRQVQLLEKNHRHAFGIEVTRHKETQKRLLELEEELNRVRKQRSSLNHQRSSANESAAMVPDAGEQRRPTQRRSESESKSKPAKKASNNSRAIQPTDQSPSQPVVSPKPAKAKSKALAINPRKKAKSRSVSKRSASISDEAHSTKDDSSSSDAPSPHPAVVGASKLNAKLALNLDKSQKANSTLTPPTAANNDVNKILDNLTFRRDGVNRERTFAVVNKDDTPPRMSQAARMSSIKTNLLEPRHHSLPQQPTAVSSKVAESDPFAGLKPARVTRNASQNSSKSQPTQTARRNSLFDELFGPKRQTQSAELRLKILSDYKDEDLFPELKQKQHTSASNAATARSNVGLFPWEKNQNAAGASASVKNYNIAQFSS